MVVSLFFHSAWITFLKRLTNKALLYYPLAFVYWIFTFFIIGSSLAFKNINDIFPNYYTLLYFKTEPQSALMIIRDVLGWKEITISVLLIIFISWISKNLIDRFAPNLSFQRILLILTFPILIFEGLVFYHKKFDQCAMVDVNFFACVQRHLTTWDDHSTFKGKGLGVRTVTLPIDSKKPAPFNVIVIVCESLRKKSLGCYGHSNNTTPLLDAFIKENKSSSYLFQNPFTVSTTTMLAVPATLSGIGPYQDSSLLYTQPLIWDYAAQFNYKRFFLSSHTLEWYRFANFYKNDQLDIWWNRDNSNLPYFNDLGVKDEYTINKAIRTINSFDNEPFAGVIQLNTTHYPYNVPEPYHRWNSSYAESYDNAVYYQDAILGKLFKALKKSKKLHRTVIIITTDHGESLMEHHNIGHVESNYYETIAIPLFAYIPEQFLSETQQKNLIENKKRITSNIDVVPTLLELWKVHDKKEWQNFTKRLTGYSLIQKIPKDRNIISLNNNQIASFNTGLSLINESFHLLLRTNLNPPKLEWYRSEDENEMHDLGPKLPHNYRNRILKAIQGYPICEPFLPYLNSKDFKSTKR